MCICSNRDDFAYYLGKIDSYNEGASTPYTVVLGDFNANTRDRNSRFGKDLHNFCTDANLMISDMVFNTHRDRFTFYSDTHAPG